jgi:LPS export ABC transporter protein LptC
MPGRAVLVFAIIGLASCSFDYGSVETLDETRPDLIMTDVEYVRVRDGKPLVRLQAESAERFEKARKMNVRSPRFEQFLPDGTGGAKGVAASAEIDLATGDVFMSGGVSVSVPDEDVLIETEALSWKDEAKGLTGPENGAVLIKKGDGTYLSGIGFAADARSRSWDFTGTVNGTWVDSEDSPKTPAESDSVPPAEPAVAKDTVSSEPPEAGTSSTKAVEAVDGIVLTETDTKQSTEDPKSLDSGAAVPPAEVAP